MSTDATRYACDLLRIALDLLDDEESLAAAAMISGAIDVIERKTAPVPIRPGMNWVRLGPSRGARSECRSCA